MKLHASGDRFDISLTDKQLLLQATHLKNTDWVYGVVVYTGDIRAADLLSLAHTRSRRKRDESGSEQDEAPNKMDKTRPICQSLHGFHLLLPAELSGAVRHRWRPVAEPSCGRRKCAVATARARAISSHCVARHCHQCWYLDIGEARWFEFLIIPLRFLLLNSMMIPISLKGCSAVCCARLLQSSRIPRYVQCQWMWSSTATRR